MKVVSRVRADAVLHRHHRRRLSVGQRQAAARRPRRRRDGDARRDPLAVRRRPDVRADVDAGHRPLRAPSGARAMIDAPPMAARACSRLAGGRRRAFAPGHLVARRQAAAARQAVRPPVSAPASPTSREQAGLTQPIVYGGVDTQALHRRGRRLRRRVPRLRQRRLARHASS